MVNALKEKFMIKMCKDIKYGYKALKGNKKKMEIKCDGSYGMMF